MENKDNVQHFLDLIRRSQRGKFKIYIGMIAGVGKTYRMLQDAKEMLEHGTDVRIGYVETHGRADTEALLEGLPIIPRKKIFYKGKEMEEMDIDVILQLHPEIVIVDELAHSNIEGSRNTKRWQDVMEMLDAGINVISAVNIQHIESLNDDIFNMVGIRVQERIPDKVLQEADEVVNIDLTSEELIDRLKAGKIYRQEKIPIALAHFFKSENILQLRELALKEVAFRVGKKVESEVTISNFRSSRQERVLVCVSSNAETQRSIIRKAARLTARCDGVLYALYIQTPSEDTDKIPLATQRHLMGHLELAAQLGGNIRQVVSKNLERAIIETCKTEKITTVCMGHPSFAIPKIWFKIFSYDKFLKTLAEMKIDLVIFA